MHLALLQRLLESDTHFLKPLASLLDIINRDRDMAKALLHGLLDIARGDLDIRVAGGVTLELGVRFAAVVVCEL